MGLTDNLRTRIRDIDDISRWTDEQLRTFINDAIEFVNRDFDQTITLITVDGTDPSVPTGYNSILMLRAAIIAGQADTADPDKFTQFVTQDTNIDPRLVLDGLRKRLLDMTKEYNSYIDKYGSVRAEMVAYDGEPTGSLEDAV